MMKQARILLTRSLCDQGVFKASTIGRGFATKADSSSINNGRGFSIKDAAKPSGRVMAPYAIFKGKAALSVQPVLPSFIKVESGNFRIDRRGSMMMTFMPAVGERKYDWEKKQMFALSPTEVGSLISMGSTDSSEFFHDPSMKSSNAGQVRKSLSIKPHANGSGYFISLSVNNSILKTNDFLVVPVTTAEFAVLKTAFSFALPHIMGWHRITGEAGTTAQGITSYPKAESPPLGLEWV